MITESELLDNSQFVGAVFFDLKKAFDKVWHAGLLSKLSAAGVSGSAFLWFEDFLTRRTQRTVVGPSVSAELSPSAGVPQGAILSPLSFLVYVNDLPGAVSAGEANLFADDTSVYVADWDLRCLQRCLQTAVDEVQVWMEKWLVTVNALKSAVMVFRTSHMAHASISLSINGELIKQVTVHRHLGLQLDECLTWSAHAAHVICKLSQRIGLLHRLRRRLPPPAIRDIYISTLLPVADYACIVWGPGLRKGDCAKLEKVHRRAARLISGTKLADNISHDLVLARAGLSPLSVQRQFRLAQFASRFSKGFVPGHLLDSTDHWFTSPPVRSRSLRHSLAFRLPRAKKAILTQSPLFAALSLWNSFPQSLRSSSRSELKEHFFS